MAVLTYEELVTKLSQQIKENGNHEITGNVLNLYIQNFLDSATLKHVVTDTAARNSITTKYVGMRVFVVSEDKTYILKADGNSWGEMIEDAYSQSEVDSLIDNKVDKVAGKGLSTNDFTNPDKAKLDSVQADATKNATDAELRDRTTHTGEQPTSSITGLDAIIAGILDDILNIELGSIIFTVKGIIVTTVETYKVTSDDYTIISVNNSGSDRAVILPDTTESEGRIIVVKKGDNLGNLLTVYPFDYTASISNSDSPQMIEDSFSFIIPSYEDSVTFQEKEGKWYIISSHIAPPIIPDANTTTKGIVERATQSEVHTGTDDTRYISPKKLNSEKGISNGIASLDSGGKVPVSQLPNSVAGGIKVIGMWNANTNTPDLSTLTLNQGEAYQVSVAGSTLLNGESNWSVKDLVVWDDVLTGNYFKIDNTDGVLSVNGKTGIVTLTKTDVGLGNVPDVDATDRTNHTGTQLAATISDFQASVSANSDVSQNTTDRHIHSNKAILDLITEAFTTTLKSAYDTASAWVTTNGTNVLNHLANTANPHSVTKTQVGLSNVDDVKQYPNSNPSNFTAAETTSTIGSLINSATSKATPIDADQLGLMDSASGNILKKLSWVNLKATLKTYFDTIYQVILSIATTTDINTGTDNVKYITSLGLAGSKYIAWNPRSIPIGALSTVGATTGLNVGVGGYISFKSGASNKVVYNDSLVGTNGVAYDGSNLAVKLHWRIDANGSPGDTVRWLVQFAIIKPGDNSNTTYTALANQDVDVSAKLQDIDFSTTLGTMTGVTGGETLMIDLTRKGSADVFTGNAEIIAFEIIKV